jgi:hypothetical protein
MTLFTNKILRIIGETCSFSNTVLNRFPNPYIK